MDFTLKTLAILCLVFLAPIFLRSATAQEISIELGASEIGMDELYTISIIVQGERIRNYDRFPEIQGFEKINTSSSTSTTIINGQVSSSMTITQTYRPQREGTYAIPPFTMLINGKEVSSGGKSVKVVAPRGSQQRQIWDPFEEFFGGRRNRTEFVDVKEDAFFALSTDKDEVYRGEGVTATLAFYVAETNRAQLQWFDLATQLQEMLTILKPQNTWEENFAIDNVQGNRITINGKNYTQYRIYQAAFYPLSLQDMVFPSVNLKMVKYLMAANPSFFGNNRQEDFVTFKTQEKRVRVKDLPAHPLKDRVPVGVYSLDERLSTGALNTGESLTYTFNVVGEGNISAIPNPTLTDRKDFEVFPPNVAQNIRRAGSKVTGNKAFSYYIIPEEPGLYAMSDLFSMVTFNPRTASYDTLRPKATITVQGESLKNRSIVSTDFGPFYDRLQIADNRLQSLDSDGIFKTIAYLVILLLLLGSGYIMFKK